jgi:hypothetical protein
MDHLVQINCAVGLSLRLIFAPQLWRGEICRGLRSSQGKDDSSKNTIVVEAGHIWMLIIKEY